MCIFDQFSLHCFLFFKEKSLDRIRITHVRESDYISPVFQLTCP